MLLIFVLFILSLYWLLSNKKIDKKTKPSIDYMNVIRQKHLERTRTDIQPPFSILAPPPGTLNNNVNNALGTPLTPSTPVTPSTSPVIPGSPVTPSTPVTSATSPVIPGSPVTPSTPVTSATSPVIHGSPVTPVTPPGTPNTVPDTQSPPVMNESILMDDITFDKDPTTGKFNIFTLESDCLE